MMPSQALKSVCQPMRRDEALASQPHIWMNALEKKIMIYNQIWSQSEVGPTFRKNIPLIWCLFPALLNVNPFK